MKLIGNNRKCWKIFFFCPFFELCICRGKLYILTSHIRVQRTLKHIYYYIHTIYVLRSFVLMTKTCNILGCPYTSTQQPRIDEIKMRNKKTKQTQHILTSKHARLGIVKCVFCTPIYTWHTVMICLYDCCHRTYVNGTRLFAKPINRPLGGMRNIPIVLIIIGVYLVTCVPMLTTYI